MLPLPRTLAQARRTWHQDFDHYCDALPVQQRTRVLTDKDTGTKRTEHYYVQPKAAPTTAKDLMTDLVFMSVRALEQRNREPGFDFGQVGTDAAPEVPSISVNCRQLGQRRRLSSRTVRTHIDLLLKLGAIEKKAWHGTRANFELWINPKYVWNAPEKAVDNDLDQLRLAAILQGDGTKFPLSVAFETHDTGESVTGHGEKLLPREARDPRLETRATLTGNTGPQPNPLPAASTAETASGAARRGPRAAARAKAAKAVAVPKPAMSLKAQKQLVMSLWAYARTQLYAGVAFSDEQHCKAQNAIWYGVFGAFAHDLSEKEWGLYHQQALERVDLVADWLKRDAGRFLPAPYAEIVKGRGYFDAENSRGFVATEEWLARKLVNQHKYQVTATLRKAGAELRGWRLRNASARVLALTYSQLYHKHLKKVQALRDDRAMDQFVALLTTFKQ